MDKRGVSKVKQKKSFWPNFEIYFNRIHLLLKDEYDYFYTDYKYLKEEFYLALR